MLIGLFKYNPASAAPRPRWGNYPGAVTLSTRPRYFFVFVPASNEAANATNNIPATTAREASTEI
jgi:hypothetical protein